MQRCVVCNPISILTTRHQRARRPSARVPPAPNLAPSLPRLGELPQHVALQLIEHSQFLQFVFGNAGNRQWWVFDNIHRPFAAPFGVWFRVGSGWLPRAGPFPQRIGTAAPPMQVPSPPPSRCPAPLLRCPPRWRAADVGGVDRAGCSLHLRPGRLAAWSPLTENPWLADSEAAGFGCLVSVVHHLAFARPAGSACVHVAVLPHPGEYEASAASGALHIGR